MNPVMDFNTLTSPAALLATRRSGKARDLIAPGPDTMQLRAILEAGMRVPDHGKLAPWRFITVGPDRRAALAGMLEQALLNERPTASDMDRAAVRAFATEAPALIVTLSRPVSPSNIPLWEQELSAGASAMQICNAAHAQGFAANWLTGWAAFSPAVHAAIAEPGERITGFIFIGTPARALEERPRPAFDAVVRKF